MRQSDVGDAMEREVKHKIFTRSGRGDVQSLLNNAHLPILPPSRNIAFVSILSAFTISLDGGR